jgi:general secretion pathway protein G
MRTTHRRAQRGFTLIELLVVFTLLALLLTIAVPRYLETTESARIKVREQNIATIRDALDKFKADQGHFPTKIEDLVEKRYLRAIPMDPVTESVDWVIVEDPTKQETGVFDIAAPSADSPTTTTAESAPVTAPAAAPAERGAMPVPNGAAPVAGGTMPTPMNKQAPP